MVEEIGIYKITGTGDKTMSRTIPPLFGNFKVIWKLLSGAYLSRLHHMSSLPLM
jgi:hypothetical protein